MELDHREDHRDVEQQKPEHSEPIEPTTFTTPFASEGLEQLRDSHC